MILKDLENALPEMKAGSHILYIFNQIYKYIQNSVNFILDGLQKDEVALFIDTKESFEKIINELRKVGYNSNQLQNLLFVESTETYELMKLRITSKFK